MAKSIVYSSLTKNTKLLAETIKGALDEVDYFGKLTDDSMNSDTIYVGFWTQGFTAPQDVKDYLAKLDGKKIFLFGTAGYNDTPEYFKSILDAVKECISDNNEIIGEFMCQGKVSAPKQEAIKKMDMAKYESMKANLDKSQSHPDQNDLDNLLKLI